MEILRRDELQELLDVVRMNPYGKFLITGISGSGKTFLLNIIGKILEEQGKKIWYENMAFSQRGNKIWKHPSEFEEVVCLVDGLDKIYRYTPIYSDGGKPELIEDDVFRIIIPLDKVLPMRRKSRKTYLKESKKFII